MTKSFAKRLGALLCMLVLLAGAVPAQPVYAESLKEKIERLEGELEEINASIEGLSGEIAKNDEAKRQYLQQLAVSEELLAASEENIAQTTADIEKKQDEIAAKRQVIYENEELFKSRLVAIYKMNTANPLTTLLSVNSFAELLTVSQNLQVLTQHDTDLLDMLATQREELEVQLDELDALLVKFNQESADHRLMIEEYNGRVQTAQNNINWAEGEIQTKEAQYEETHEELEQAQEDMRKIQAQLSSQGSTSWDGSTWENGTLTWPVPGFYGVSCEFGSADPNGAAHRGMDINGGGISGAAIVAGDDGVVLVASNAHYSYGNYVVIDHGGGMKSLYAHCSSLNVSVGQTVKRGDPIAYVGSTGFSTGPHLHFEVHQDGALQNPRNYLAA